MKGLISHRFVSWKIELTLKALEYRIYVFYALEGVSRYRDPQLQVDQNHLQLHNSLV